VRQAELCKLVDARRIESGLLGPSVGGILAGDGALRGAVILTGRMGQKRILSVRSAARKGHFGWSSGRVGEVRGRAVDYRKYAGEIAGGSAVIVSSREPAHHARCRAAANHHRALPARRNAALDDPVAAAWKEAARDRDASSRSRRGRGDSADLPEQAQGVPVDPFFDEPAVDDMAEQLSVYVDRLAGGSGALQFPAVDPAQ
jgi:hypothetical protein